MGCGLGFEIWDMNFEGSTLKIRFCGVIALHCQVSSSTLLRFCQRNLTGERVLVGDCYRACIYRSSLVWKDKMYIII